MASTVKNSCGLTLYDVSTQTKTRTILGSMKNVLSTTSYIKTNPGHIYYKNGKKMHRIYFTFNEINSVDTLMKNRSLWCSQTEKWKVIRTLPNTLPFYCQCVTGLKIKIDQSTNNEYLNEFDLRKYFDPFGKIVQCQWINDERTEAFFTFADYDSVDQIIITHSSLEIKGIKINLEKTPTANDMTTYERFYMIHVTNLPLCVTSEQVSSNFKIPIARILLYPYYKIEKSYVKDGRSSSEAWIKMFPDENTAQKLAERKNNTFIGKNRIKCEVMPETIHEEELCEQFQIGQCQYTSDKCFYKHLSCSLRDTCDDQNCWLGHSNKRETVSIKRPQFRSENARYRLRFGNLPSDITQEELIARLPIPNKFSLFLILRENEENSKSPQIAYLIRQQLENRLRIIIDKCHGKPFSLILTQHIQCQLELNQDFYDWNDSNEIISSVNNTASPSPALSTHTDDPNRINRAPYHSLASGMSNWKPNSIKHLDTNKSNDISQPVSTDQSTIPKQKRPTNSFKSKSVHTIRPAPSDFPNISGRSCWSKEMIENDSVDSDEYYWMEDERNKEKNVLTKIYSPKTDRKSQIRALRERAALERLKGLSTVPKLFQSNFGLSENHSLGKEFWTIMKFINGERLSDYLKSNKMNFREALQITQQLLNIVKEIHSKNVIHRDIQPKNILIQQRSNDEQMTLQLINFGCAFIRNYQWENSREDIDDYLGNKFYKMPQFEQRSTQTKPYEQSPTIDATSICTILFWILTGLEPRESKDIDQKSPHQIGDRSERIRRQINQIKDFRMEMEVHKHLYRHVILLFDRAFTNPAQQWSVNELDYELRFLIALIDDDQSRVNQKTNNQTLFSSVPLNDHFVYLVSLVHHLKHHFVDQHDRCSMNEKNHWSSQDDIIEHKHLLIYYIQEKSFSVEIHWHIKILENQKFQILIQAKDEKNINIQLPLGCYSINDQTSQLLFRNFQTEIKILIQILSQSIAS